MKYIDRSQVGEPAILQESAAPTKEEEVDDGIYGHDDVKKALNQLQRGICCYCESRYNHTTFGDVEHFRPKKGYKQDEKDVLHKPGYYWLAHKWENLMYACEQCNRVYKHNYFPLKDRTKRFDPKVCDISQEEPLLINPYEEKNPENHLTFVGTAIKPLTDKGVASITYYGLERKELDEPRQEVYNDIIAFIDAVKIAEGTSAEAPMIEKLKARINGKIAAGQHTLMVKSNFGKYLDI